MGKFNKQGLEFSLEGRFLGLVLEDGDIKYLRLATVEGEFGIKICKKLRASWDLRLLPGDWVQVVGEKKLDQSGKLKLKAEQVIPAATVRGATDLPAKAKQAKTKANILVCQKSDCMKRGGKAVCQALAVALSDRGLEDQVAIKGTGCMKNCSSGPNLIMPDKTHHSRIKATQIPELLDKHLTDSLATVE